MYRCNKFLVKRNRDFVKIPHSSGKSASGAIAGVTTSKALSKHLHVGTLSWNDICYMRTEYYYYLCLQCAPVYRNPPIPFHFMQNNMIVMVLYRERHRCWNKNNWLWKTCSYLQLTAVTHINYMYMYTRRSQCVDTLPYINMHIWVW